MAYIANLQFDNWHVRMHFALHGTSDAAKNDTEAKFRRTLSLIENEVGPASKTRDEFLRSARAAFKAAGFDEIRA